jgi:hypothetical protein
VLPKKVDKDPAWRVTAIYTREEIEVLISDARITEDRLVLYALKALGGLRHGEAASLRWRQYDDGLEPLGGLSLEHTKTQVPRRIPVHPTLARVLGEWKSAGFERTYGRAPTAVDLVVPTRNFTERSAQETPKQLHDDLRTLGLRERRGHDLRRTFVTLAQVDGARRDLLETMSHGPRGDIVSIYTSFPWPALCAEIAKLKIELRSPSALDGGSKAFATGFATAHVKGRNRWLKIVTPSGIGGRRDVTGPRLVTGPPTEGSDAERLAVTPECHECSEALDAVREAVTVARRLAMVADNAILNGDFQRARAALRDLHETVAASHVVDDGSISSGL